MAKNVIRDETGILRQLAKKVINETPDFLSLKQLKFIFTWYVGEEPEKDSEKTYIAASVRKLPIRERDLYGRDVEFRVNREMWNNANEESHYRLIWHELCHIGIRMDEEFNIVLDDDGRVSFTMLSHDVVIKTFAKELDQFGLPPDLVYPSEVVAKAFRKYRKKDIV
jgi:hypothetical protein